MKTSSLAPDILQSPKWHWHIPDALTADAVRKLALTDDCLIKKTAVRAVYRCGDYYLKFEFGTSALTTFRNRFRPKARQECEIGLSLAAAGIPAVECLGWGQLGGTNVLITRALPCTVPFEAYYYEHIIRGGGNADGILSDVTAFLQKFFDAGFLHRDLHFGNILYNPATRTFAWVDLVEISRPDKLTDADRNAMCRCIVTLRGGLTRAQMLRAIRAIGAAATDDEAEAFYFDEIRRTARHLLETWEKRCSQFLDGYPKFTVTLPYPGDPDRKILLRKDWLSRPILTAEAIAQGIPAGYELLRMKNETAKRMFLRSLYLQTLRIRHRRVAAFAEPDEIWLEPLPEGMLPAPPAPDDPELAFFRRTLDEQMINAPPESLCRLPDGSFYLRDLTGVYTGFEAQ